MDDELNPLLDEMRPAEPEWAKALRDEVLSVAAGNPPRTPITPATTETVPWDVVNPDQVTAPDHDLAIRRTMRTESVTRTQAIHALWATDISKIAAAERKRVAEAMTAKNEAEWRQSPEGVSALADYLREQQAAQAKRISDARIVLKHQGIDIEGVTDAEVEQMLATPAVEDTLEANTAALEKADAARAASPFGQRHSSPWMQEGDDAA